MPLPDPRLVDLMRRDTLRQVDFFRANLCPGGALATPDVDGRPLPGPQEIMTTARLVHSYALAKLVGLPGCDAIIDAGMSAC